MFPSVAQLPTPLELLLVIPLYISLPLRHIVPRRQHVCLPQAVLSPVSQGPIRPQLPPVTSFSFLSSFLTRSAFFLRHAVPRSLQIYLYYPLASSVAQLSGPLKLLCMTPLYISFFLTRFPPPLDTLFPGVNMSFSCNPMLFYSRSVASLSKT